MLKQFLLDLKLHKKDFLLPLIMVPLCFALGFGLCCLIMFNEEDPGSWVTVGTFLAWISLFVTAVLNFGRYYQEFMLALSMGRTRRAFQFSFALRTLLELGMGCGLILALYRLELAAGNKLFAPWPLEDGFGFLTDWRMFAIGLPALVIVAMFVGQLYSRFGRNVMGILSFAALAVCMVIPRLLDTEESTNAVLTFFRSVPDWGWLAAGAVAAVAMVAAVIGLGRNQMVK